MHPLLDVEKRAGECGPIIEALEDCRKNHYLHFKYSPVSPCDTFSVALQTCLKALKAQKLSENADKNKRSRDRFAEAMRRAKAEEAAQQKSSA